MPVRPENIYQCGELLVGTTSPDKSAIVNLDSTTRGALLSRMTTTQRDAIESPATGLLIYNTTTQKYNFYNGTEWKKVEGDGGGCISGSGTAGKLAKFTDTEDIGNSVITEDEDGNVGIGVEAPTEQLTLPGTKKILWTGVNPFADPTPSSVYTEEADNLNVESDLNAGREVHLGNFVQNHYIAVRKDGVVIDDIPGLSIGTSANPDAATILNLVSTTKGVLFPRMTEAQRDAISTPAEGLTIYNLDSNHLNVFNGTAWKELAYS